MKKSTLILFTASAIGIAAIFFAAREGLALYHYFEAKSESSQALQANNQGVSEPKVTFARCNGDETRWSQSGSETSKRKEYIVRLSEQENRISYYGEYGGQFEFCTLRDCETKIQPWRATIVTDLTDSILSFVLELDRKTGDLHFFTANLDNGIRYHEFIGLCVPSVAPAFDTADNVL